MKIITIVGIRKSGKTSTVTALTEAIVRRGKTVGTCKSVFCPTFSIDAPHSNTAKHKRAGAQIICARGKNETAFIYPRALPLSETLAPYAALDYVLLEGDYLAPVPRLVTAHHTADALERQNEHTFAFAGRIAAQADEELPLPRFNPLTQADALLDYIDTHVPDTALSPALNEDLPPVAGVTGDGFCQCGCHKHERKAEADAAYAVVDGQTLSLAPAQQALLRTWAEEQA